jgi:hypothetical protein
MGLTIGQLRARLDRYPDDAQVLITMSSRQTPHEVKGLISDENVNPLHLWTSDPEVKPVFVLLVAGHETPLRIGPRDLKRAYKLAR